MDSDIQKFFEPTVCFYYNTGQPTHPEDPKILCAALLMLASN